ncbi:DUF4411 family protein [Frateuria aurantia]|uniref:Putative nucleic acid-binding protein, contains PIN domain n=1 Tax=Frateuria aurantia (strain ATCC 33424 / DSM 6220 / KCTC 2777 / LMG 1558 / NBRC 3245 / NCIMB 13370) TaxID=767434 RepID=H8L5D4_FRAAD|nr:DUF4411 family protein [Frateuria aurantia]AFC85091.1 putative nucleic acid-binding protein, contains PIN domain [Frateuria aurantia DSM 6220]
MQVFDASSMIHAWDNYPVTQFPGLWAWLAQQIEQGQLLMAQVAVEEVEHKAPECMAWLRDAGLHRLPITQAILLEALRIKTLLGIVEDRYGGGVDENDLLIVATAKLHGHTLVTNEAPQLTPHKKMSNWKIPAVCAMESVRAPCIDFVGYIKRSGAVFG